MRRSTPSHARSACSTWCDRSTCSRMCFACSSPAARSSSPSPTGASRRRRSPSGAQPATTTTGDWCAPTWNGSAFSMWSTSVSPLPTTRCSWSGRAQLLPPPTEERERRGALVGRSREGADSQAGPREVILAPVLVLGDVRPMRDVQVGVEVDVVTGGRAERAATTGLLAAEADRQVEVLGPQLYARRLIGWVRFRAHLLQHGRRQAEPGAEELDAARVQHERSLRRDWSRRRVHVVRRAGLNAGQLGGRRHRGHGDRAGVAVTVRDDVRALETYLCVVFTVVEPGRPDAVAGGGPAAPSAGFVGGPRERGRGHRRPPRPAG